MGKYETKFKLKVVESFLAGDGGAKLLARRWSVPEEKIRTWVSHYQVHGVAGLQPKRGAYTAHFKLEVLSYQDREQLSSRQVAAIYDIRNPNQVVVWRRAFDGGGVAALEVRRQAHRMKADKPDEKLPVKAWHTYLDDPTLADAILDRVVHSSHKIELKGRSLRDQATPTHGTEAQGDQA